MSDDKQAYVLQQYEALRRQVFDKYGRQGTGLGMALFLTRGMAAWLTALRDLQPPSIVSSSHVPGVQPPTKVSMSSELIVAVAEMILVYS